MTQQSPFQNGLSVEPPEEMVHLWSEAIYAITEDDDTAGRLYCQPSRPVGL
jgi:hypothetical protein